MKPMRAESDGADDAERRVAGQQAERRRSRRRHEAGDDELEAEEVDRAQVARVAGHRQPLLGSTDLLRAGEALGDAGQARGQRAQGAFEERLLELDLLERPGLHRAELRQPGLDRIHRPRAGDGVEDEQHADAGDGRHHERNEHLSRPRCRRCGG